MIVMNKKWFNELKSTLKKIHQSEKRENEKSKISIVIFKTKQNKTKQKHEISTKVELNKTTQNKTKQNRTK
jgi:hypothetical protein